MDNMKFRRSPFGPRRLRLLTPDARLQIVLFLDLLKNISGRCHFGWLSFDKRMQARSYTGLIWFWSQIECAHQVVFCWTRAENVDRYADVAASPSVIVTF